jgi:hypothetical protein
MKVTLVIIIIINYSNITIQINISHLDNNTIFNFGIITFLNLEDLTQVNKCKFSCFRDILYNLGFTFNSNPSILFVLE